MHYLPVKEFAKYCIRMDKSRMPLLGLDIGTKLVGVALSDPSKQFVNPLTVLKRKHPRMAPSSLKSFAKELGDTMKANRACGVVIGLPMSLDGGDLTPLAEEIVEMFDTITSKKYITATIRTNAQEQEQEQEGNASASASDSDSEVGVVYTFWDERYSTREALRIVQSSSKKGVHGRAFQNAKDKLAAGLILAGYQKQMIQPLLGVHRDQ